MGDTKNHSLSDPCVYVAFGGPEENEPLLHPRTKDFSTGPAILAFERGFQSLFRYCF